MARTSTKSKEETNQLPAKSEQVARKKVVVTTEGYGGICSTCNQAAECVHLKRNPDVVVWHCENYDDYVPPGEMITDRDIAKITVDLVPTVEEVGGELKGLCIDCENRDGCVHAMKTGGVWHCEEYQ
jgi:hypothetical protein